MIYFDHCASTLPYEEVIQAVAETQRTYYGNPSSLHRLGAEAQKLLDKSRETIARALGVDAASLLFTSGGTESNNLAIKGAAFQYRSRGRHLITTEIEHPSVYECFRQLEQFGYDVTYLPVDSSGIVNMAELEKALTNETILVSIMHVNNETGSVQPVQQIGELLRRYPKTIFHVDAVQSLGKLPLKPELWSIDLVSWSAHKVRGPRGAGLLYKRKGVALFPLLAGGGQESGFRSGTENVPGIVGMAKAIRMTMEHNYEHAARMTRLRSRLLDGLSAIDGVTYNGSLDDTEMAPHIVNISCPGFRSEVILHALEQRHIYVSTRSACSSDEEEPSRVILAMGGSRARAASTLRICLSPDHTERDIDGLVTALRHVLEELIR